MRKPVLIVDDSATVQASVDFTLKQESYPVLKANNGREALDLLSGLTKEGSDLGMIITDVNMPVMDGISFIREVKHTPFKFIPILVLTTESEEDKKSAGRDAGASGWLVKPFSPNQLLEVVAKFTA